MFFCFSRRYLILEDQYQTSQAEFQEKQDEINKMIPSESENHKKEVERKHLMHVLENERVRLNNTYGLNRYLKIDINIQRKEIV